MTDFLSSTKKVTCPDGSPRYILKRPEKAFSIHFPEWDVRIKNLLDLYSGLDFKTDVVAKKKTQTIVKELTENYAALQAHYLAAYLSWCGNPCSTKAEREFNKEKKLIRSKEYELRKIEVDSELSTKRSGRVLFRKVPLAYNHSNQKNKRPRKVEIEYHAKEKHEKIAEEQEFGLRDEICYSEVGVMFPVERLDKIHTLVSSLKI